MANEITVAVAQKAYPKRVLDNDPSVTAEFVRSLFRFFPRNGVFVWRKRPSPYSKRFVGDIAGCLSQGDHPYWLLCFRKRSYPASRVAWLYMTGEWPGTLLKFIDGDSLNCAFDNLELMTSLSQRDKDLKYGYGLDLNFYETQYQKQEGLCAICKKPETKLGSKGGVLNLCIDHNHNDNSFRGLLCNKCNIAIGNMDDSPDKLRAAALYLERRKSDIYLMPRQDSRRSLSR